MNNTLRSVEAAIRLFITWDTPQLNREFIGTLLVLLAMGGGAEAQYSQVNTCRYASDGGKLQIVHLKSPCRLEDYTQSNAALRFVVD